MRRNSGIIGPRQKIQLNASGVHEIFDHYNCKVDNAWPYTKKVTSVTGSNGSNFDENVNTTFTVQTEGFEDGDTLYYSIATVSGPALTSADFGGGDITGSFTVNGSGVGTFIVRPLGDGVAENNTSKIQIRLDSVSGQILGETATLTMADAAVQTGNPTFTWKYHAYGASINNTRVYWVPTTGSAILLRTISGQQHTTSASTWDSYTENLSSYSGQTGRIYIRYEQGTSFTQDIAFDDMSLNDTTSGNIDHDPGNSTGRSRWQKRSSGSTTTSTPPTSDAFNAVPIGTSTANIWNFDVGGTGSSSTGPSADASGSSTGYYLYFEGSSPNYGTAGTYFWLRMSADYTLL